MGKIGNTANLISVATFSLCLSFAAFVAPAATDNSLSLFQYATPLEFAPVSASQLAELRLSKPMFNALRRDFADLRVVRNPIMVLFL